MQFTIHTNKRKLTLIVDDNKSITLDNVLLMVAQYYGEEWYGASVQDNKGNFICNAVKEYYEEGDPTKSVYQWAIDKACGNIRMKAGLYTTSYDWREDSEVYHYGYDPFKYVGPAED